ncbi:tyrosine-protein kinase-like otk [Eupeodes corollae]|uniref:tyrosine-protein kinase-like otk n=1 Tax=Eupeodes corollae TaxID=290404 RepID=UPI0024933290|nr:tyrosine-protein kinase-like otk [Eupeodes corollae]
MDLLITNLIKMFSGFKALLGVNLFIGFLSLSVIGRIHGETSRFVTLPQSQTVIEGDSVVFTCHATPVGGMDYSWTHNGHAIQNSTRVHQVGSNLHVNNVVKDVDGGDYACIATTDSSGARQASPPARLNIIWIQTASVQLLTNRKDEVVLKCHVEGTGQMEIEWFRNSEKLTSIQNIHLDGNRLLIKSPSVYDNGLYRCVASNPAGRAMSKKGYVLKWAGTDSQSGSGCIPRFAEGKKGQKILADKSSKNVFLCRGKRGDKSVKATVSDVSFTQQPSVKQVAKENEAVELPCTYQLPEKYRSTAVQLRWRKDGKVFRQTDLGVSTSTTAEPNMESMLREDFRITLNRANGSLMFSSVIASDAGQYYCQIYIEGHSPITSETGELVVIEQLKFAPQPTSKNLELGSVGKIHCKAQGTPTPQVKWIRDFSDQLPETIDDINGTLIFKNVSAENRGNYTCIASNTQGQINATVSIAVVVAPKFSVAPEGPIQATEMGVASIHCQAIGDPKPTIQWDKDLKYLSENNTDKNRFKFLENGTLEITEVHLDDEGRYGCTIGNSAGLKREEVRFVVKAVEGFATEESSDGFLITRAVLITMSVAFAYIILVVGLMLWCRYRRQARKARLTEAGKDNIETGEVNTKMAEIEPCLPENGKSDKNSKTKKMNGNNNPRGSGNEAQKSDDTISSVNSKGSKKSHAFDQLALPRSSLSELIQIGRGEFGDVFVGKIKSSLIKINEASEKDTDERQSGTPPNMEKRRSKTSMDDIEEIKEEQESSAEVSDEYKLILVKALNKIKDETACQEFKRQIEMFRAISHKGVVKLFGLCREKDPHYLVLEYTDWGDLKQFLLATAGKANTATTASGQNGASGAVAGSIPPLKTGQILAVAYQIARGMDAIYRARYIHKDLATRNCIISSDFIVKVSYPGLSKDKYNREYFKHRNTLLPIRWLAPECIQEDEFTTKSDIYAYGVVVWELFNQATKLPFEEFSNEEYLQKSSGGSLKWDVAEGTPEALKEIMASCWNQNPKDRPSFSQLCTALSKAMQSSDN